MIKLHFQIINSCQLLRPLGEYEGTHLSAPKRPGFQGHGKENIRRVVSQSAAPSDEESDSDDESEGKTRECTY